MTNIICVYLRFIFSHAESQSRRERKAKVYFRAICCKILGVEILRLWRNLVELGWLRIRLIWLSL
jgi:hypothetical protein